MDAYRIDTLKFIEPDFARLFGNAMREYALSVGKKNFFTFGEVFDEEEKIAQFIGRNAGLIEDPIGVDASLDFPLFFRLPASPKDSFRRRRWWACMNTANKSSARCSLHTAKPGAIS